MICVGPEENIDLPKNPPPPLSEKRWLDAARLLVEAAPLKMGPWSAVKIKKEFGVADFFQTFGRHLVELGRDVFVGQGHTVTGGSAAFGCNPSGGASEETPSDEVLIQGIPCIQGTASFHPDGRLKEARLAQNTPIHGFQIPKGSLAWFGDLDFVHLRCDDVYWVDSGVGCEFVRPTQVKVTLSQDTSLLGIRFPAGSEIYFHCGKVIKAKLSEDTVIDGLLYRKNEIYLKKGELLVENSLVMHDSIGFFPLGTLTIRRRKFPVDQASIQDKVIENAELRDKNSKIKEDINKLGAFSGKDDNDTNGDPEVTKLPCPLPSFGEERTKVSQALSNEKELLFRRKDSLIARFAEVVSLNAMKGSLGTTAEKFIAQTQGLTLEFAQPDFRMGQPKSADIRALEKFAAKKKGQKVNPGDLELEMIAESMFLIPWWVIQNFSDLADRMNEKMPIKGLAWSVEGHTDSQGSAIDNQELSERRARAAVLFLQIFGVQGNRLEAKGYGESSLAVPESGGDEQILEAQRQNRRIVIRLKGEVPWLSQK